MGTETSGPTNRVEELLNQEIPGKLWHYTSVQGFHGIVTSRRIFATHIRFLNDYEEFIHAREVAAEIIADAPEWGANFFPLRLQLAKAVDLAFGGQLSDLLIFVACFSASEDQLSQWRGYSNGSSGVSLAFQLSALRPPGGRGILASFAPCVYDPAEKKALLSDALSHFMKETQGYWDAAFQAFGEYNGSRPGGWPGLASCGCPIRASFARVGLFVTDYATAAGISYARALGIEALPTSP